ncbi:MAG: hypothetical protein IJO52_07850, partial [Clostridia bacterium]|nr:hypothetical protein [Clostridia bacterium]
LIHQGFIELHAAASVQSSLNISFASRFSLVFYYLKVTFAENEVKILSAMNEDNKGQISALADELIK